MTEAQKYVIRDLRREVVALQRERDEARAEVERLTDLKRTCQCSEENQCMFASERDDARTELSKKAGELAECRRLLREAVTWCGDVCTNDDEVETWLDAARKAAGGDDDNL